MEKSLPEKISELREKARHADGDFSLPLGLYITLYGIASSVENGAMRGGEILFFAIGSLAMSAGVKDTIKSERLARHADNLEAIQMQHELQQGVAAESTDAESV